MKLPKPVRRVARNLVAKRLKKARDKLQSERQFLREFNKENGELLEELKSRKRPASFQEWENRLLELEAMGLTARGNRKFSKIDDGALQMTLDAAPKTRWKIENKKLALDRESKRVWQKIQQLKRRFPGLFERVGRRRARKH